MSGTTPRLLDAKYSSCPSSIRLTSGLSGETRLLLQAAFSQSTWKRHESAVNCFRSFELFSSSSFPFPLTHQILCSFASWACMTKDLKSSTVETYLSSLKTIHSLNNLDSSGFNNFVLKNILRGKENMELYSDVVKETRKVMTLPLLKILGNEIAKVDWEDHSNQVVWSVFTLAFFGSFRMGELLSPQENSFSPKDTLLWKDVSFLSPSHLIVHIKTPKSRMPDGEFIDIFEFSGHNVCPVRSLCRLRDSLSHVDQNSPVFRFSSGQLLTLNRVNSILPQLLSTHLDADSGCITGHSFRAAIPAILAKHPDVANSSDIMGWGRWKSEAYLSYTRLKLKQKQDAFTKITDLLNL